MVKQLDKSSTKQLGFTISITSCKNYLWAWKMKEMTLLRK